MKSRWQGEETKRDGALASVKALADAVPEEYMSERSRSCVAEVLERGSFAFEDRETFGEYMTVLQRCNQALFADQKKLLQQIKDLKKGAKASAPEASAVDRLSPAT